MQATLDSADAAPALKSAARERPVASVAMKRELRVLAGPQAGAKMLLEVGAETQLGSLRSRGCQIVLRDPQVIDQRIRLKVREHDVRIKVLHGRVDIAGQVLTGPCSTDWPLYTPLRVGDTVIAFGDVSSPRWEKVEPFPVAVATTPDEASAEAEAAAAIEAAAQAKPRRRVEAWLALAGAAVALVSAGLFAMMSIATPAQDDSASEQAQLARVLRANPLFRNLTVRAERNGRFTVEGDLLSQADRVALDKALEKAELSPAVSVRTGEQITSGVRDVYRMNGIAAEATPPLSFEEMGIVRLRTREADLDKLQRVSAVARRDVPGLTSLTVDNLQPFKTQPTTPVPNDPGKRVATVVPGEAPYVVTVDGTRYFIGAVLPTGHLLASITDQQVLLSKDGVVSPLVF